MSAEDAPAGWTRRHHKQPGWDAERAREDRRHDAARAQHAARAKALYAKRRYATLDDHDAGGEAGSADGDDGSGADTRGDRQADMSPVCEQPHAPRRTVPRWMAAVRSLNGRAVPESCFMPLRTVRRRLSSRDAVTRAAAAVAIAHRSYCRHVQAFLARALLCASSAVQDEALWLVTNLATEPSVDSDRVLLPLAPALIQLMDSGNAAHAHHAAWALGNLAADSEHARSTLFANGLLPPLLRLAARHADEAAVLDRLALALGNMARARAGHVTEAIAASELALRLLFDWLARDADAVQAGTPLSQAALVRLSALAWLLPYLASASSSYCDVAMGAGALDWALVILTHCCTPERVALALPFLRLVAVATMRPGTAARVGRSEQLLHALLHLAETQAGAELDAEIALCLANALCDDSEAGRALAAVGGARRVLALAYARLEIDCEYDPSPLLHVVRHAALLDAAVASALAGDTHLEMALAHAPAALAADLGRLLG